MGYSGYSEESRSERTKTFRSSSIDDNFKQNRERKAHKEMLPESVKLRESRDSELHPNSVPIILALDVTGSMGHIPQQFIGNGLPTLISHLKKAGIESPHIMFVAIGDHEMDRTPLQISQFEAGDEELDMWLQRVWLEGGGGSNYGESYSLAHFFAANYTATDAWDKRKQKGFIFTIGDEPNLRDYPATAFKEIMGEGQYSTLTQGQILEAAQEKWEVFHIFPARTSRDAEETWKELLGQHVLKAEDVESIPTLIANTIISNLKVSEKTTETSKDENNTEPSKPNKFL